MSVKTYKDKGYARVDITDPAVQDVIRSILGLNEGDLMDGLVFDGKIMPTVNIRPIYPIYEYIFTVPAADRVYFQDLDAVELGIYTLMSGGGVDTNLFVQFSNGGIGYNIAQVFCPGAMNVAAVFASEFRVWGLGDINDLSIYNVNAVDDAECYMQYWGL